MKFLVAFIFTVIFGFSFVSEVFAQNDGEIADSYGITFPIAALGDCATLSQCKAYCEVPENYQSCLAYSKEKGFYHQEGDEQSKVVSARSELGCNSISSCKAFCDQKSNWDKCREFAKKHDLGPKPKNEEEILRLARSELGCSSRDECMAFCEKDENMDKCIDFASGHGLDGGSGAQMKQTIAVLKQLLGCTSMKSCMDYCNNPLNMSKCMDVFRSTGFEAGVSGISLEECQKFNPGMQCQIEGDICNCSQSPDVWCPKAARAGETCIWEGSQCTCWNPSECESYPGCKFTGSKCDCSYQEEAIGEGCNRQPGCRWTGTDCECGNQTSSQEPGDVWCPKAAGPGEACNWDGSTCSCWNPSACEQSGCKWTGTSCECSGSTNLPLEVYSQPDSVESGQSEPPEVWCNRNAGCSWNGSFCDCGLAPGSEPQYISPEPTDSLVSPEPGSVVQGATKINILELLWEKVRQFLHV